MLFTQRVDLISRPDAPAAAWGIKITCLLCSCFIHSKLCLSSFCNLSLRRRVLRAIKHSATWRFAVSALPLPSHRSLPPVRGTLYETAPFKGHAGDSCIKNWLNHEINEILLSFFLIVSAVSLLFLPLLPLLLQLVNVILCVCFSLLTKM